MSNTTMREALRESAAEAKATAAGKAAQMQPVMYAPISKRYAKTCCG